MEPNEKEILDIKLREYKQTLDDEMRKISQPNKDERQALERELHDLNARSNQVKARIRELTENSKANRGKVLEIARKLKAIGQLL